MRTPATLQGRRPSRSNSGHTLNEGARTSKLGIAPSGARASDATHRAGDLPEAAQAQNAAWATCKIRVALAS